MRNIGRLLTLVVGTTALTATSAIAAPGAELRTEHSVNVLEASGYSSNSFVLENNGTPAVDPAITSFSIFLQDGSTALPDLIFDLDPLNPVGDEIAKNFTLDASSSGLVQGDFTVTPSQPVSGGFRRIDVTIGSGGLAPGESIGFSIDVDPLSTAGETGSAPAGPVSGAEMSGSIVEVGYADATTQTSRLAPYAPGSPAGVNARAVVPIPPPINIRPEVKQADDTDWPADATTTTSSTQFLSDSTEAASGQTVVVFKVETATRRQSGSPAGIARNLFLGNVETGGGLLFSSGQRTTSFSLERSPEDAQTESGKAVVMAYLQAADGTPGPVSLPQQVQLVPPVNSSGPSVSGTATEGETLTCDPGTWDPAAATFAYEWLRDGAPIGGATGATHVLTQEDVGAAVSCRVTATGDGGDSAETSTATAAVADAPPAATTQPAVAGTAQVGETLTCDPGTWDPADAALAFQWLRDGAEIAGATGATHALTGDDQGAAISCRVSATGDGGTTVATSPATAAVTAAPATGGGTTSGGTTSGATASATTSTPTVVAQATADALCATPKTAVAAQGSSGGSAKIEPTAAQLLINQRIAQAAVRRANAIQARLDAGLSAEDICGGSLTQADFGSSVAFGTGAAVPRVAANPAQVKTATAAGSGAKGEVTLSSAQLLINQRISQAAVRRLNAVKARIDGGLTGGDVRNGSLGAGKLAPGLVVTGTSDAPEVAASRTVVAASSGGGSGKVTASAGQLAINQKISQAAVRRANDLIVKLETGFTGDDFKDGTLGSKDLSAG